MKDLLYDVGFNDGKYHAMVSRKPVKNYLSWQGMLRRCYDKKWQTRNPTYFGCSVSENFKSYSYYHEWCLNQIGFNGLDFQLDKDLLCKGNKVYSEDNCVFLPQEINKLLTTRKAVRGELPIGVSLSKDTSGFKSQGSFGTFHKKYLGYFPTAKEAFMRYRQVKESYIKFQAEQWRQFIDPRAYAALIAYEVLITD
jgi:hypothetical protein